jgi:hypothetical protein
MSGVTRSIAPEDGGFLLCSAAPTAPSEGVLAFGRGLDAQESLGACEPQHRAHSRRAAAA